MNARTKPRYLHSVSGPIPIETPLEKARRRFGRAFAFEQGNSFKFDKGPTVLTTEFKERLEKENAKRHPK